MKKLPTPAQQEKEEMSGIKGLINKKMFGKKIVKKGKKSVAKSA